MPLLAIIRQFCRVILFAGVIFTFAASLSSGKPLATALPIGHLGVPDPKELTIGIRSGVDLKVQGRKEREANLADPSFQRATYVVVSVMKQPSPESLAGPVDARAIANKLMEVLDAQGFRRAQPGQKPDIVVTVKYGRGYLWPNPYSGEGGFTTDNLNDSGKLVARPPFFEPTTGLEERVQRADLEKLIIQVIAWKYPPPADPKEEPKILWRTSMSVDDPDHRDLNQIAAKMLELAGPFFDREISEPEVILSRPLPEGNVKLGPINVIEDPKPTAK